MTGKHRRDDIDLKLSLFEEYVVLPYGGLPNRECCVWLRWDGRKTEVI